MLPLNPERLHEAVAPYVSYIMTDRLNYQGKVRALLRERGWGYALTESYATETESKLISLFGDEAGTV